MSAWLVPSEGDEEESVLPPDFWWFAGNLVVPQLVHASL